MGWSGQGPPAYPTNPYRPLPEPPHRRGPTAIRKQLHLEAATSPGEGTHGIATGNFTRLLKAETRKPESPTAPKVAMSLLLIHRGFQATQA